MSRTLFSLAGFQVILIGRFWVIAEADATVFWNGTPVITTFVTSNQLVASLEATDLMNVGLTRVYVRTGGLNSNTVDFDVTGQ